jgi:chorismate mutase
MMPPAMRLFALRGATSIERDEASLILDGTSRLLQEILDANGLTPDDVVSCVFTCTQDLTAEYPAVAARAMGFNAVPLLCTQEMAVPGTMQRVVRLLMHFSAEPGHEVRHVYQGEARRLRLDIAGAQ